MALTYFFAAGPAIRDAGYVMGSLVKDAIRPSITVSVPGVSLIFTTKHTFFCSLFKGGFERAHLWLCMVGSYASLNLFVRPSDVT